MPNPAWKYIIVRTNDGLEFPVLFPSQILHNEMAHAVRRAMIRSQGCPAPDETEPTQTIAGAGFIGQVTVPDCAGRSESLRVGSRRVDAGHISNFHEEGGEVQS